MSDQVFYGYNIVMNDTTINDFTKWLQICILNQLANHKIHRNDVYKNFVLSRKGNVYLENKIAPKYYPLYDITGTNDFIIPSDTLSTTTDVIVSNLSSTWKTTHTFPTYITQPANYNPNTISVRPDFAFCKPSSYDDTVAKRKKIFIHSLVTGLDRITPSVTASGSFDKTNTEFTTKLNNLNKLFYNSQEINGQEYSARFIDGNNVTYSFEKEWKNEVYRVVFNCVVLSFIKAFAIENFNSANSIYSSKDITETCSKYHPKIEFETGSPLNSLNITKVGQLKIAEYLSKNEYFLKIVSDLTNQILKAYPLPKVFTNDYIRQDTIFSKIPSGIDGNVDADSLLLKNDINSYSLYKQKIIQYLDNSMRLSYPNNMNTITNFTQLESFIINNGNNPSLKYMFDVQKNTTFTDFFENMTIAKFDPELPNVVNNTSGFIFRIISFLLSFLILMYIISDYVQNKKVSYMWIGIFLVYFLITFFILSFYFADTFIEQRKLLPNDDYKNKQTYVFMGTILIAICFISMYYLFKYLLIIFYKYRSGNNPIHLAISVLVLTLVISFLICSAKIISAIYPLTAFYLLDPKRNQEFLRKPDEQKIIDIITIVLYFLLIVGFILYFAYQGYQYNKFVNLSI